MGIKVKQVNRVEQQVKYSVGIFTHKDHISKVGQYVLRVIIDKFTKNQIYGVEGDCIGQWQEPRFVSHPPWLAALGRMFFNSSLARVINTSTCF